MELYFCTTNKKKLKEFESILNKRLKEINLELYEIQDIDVENVVKKKAKDAFLKIKKPLIVEDTGLEITPLNKFPGALVKLFGKTAGYPFLCTILKRDRRAVAKTAIGYIDNKEYKCFIGEIKGTISKKERGESHFGWDNVFIPNGSKKTFGEMSFKEKNKISMRKIAINKLNNFLKNRKKR